MSEYPEFPRGYMCPHCGYRKSKSMLDSENSFGLRVASGGGKVTPGLREAAERAARESDELLRKLIEDADRE